VSLVPTDLPLRPTDTDLIGLDPELVELGVT